MSRRAEELARRVEQGATDLVAVVEEFTDKEWTTTCPDEQRTIGVVVHHVGAAYPEEAEIIRTLATEGSLEGLTWDAVNQGNHEEAERYAGIDKASTLALIRKNARVAANVVRGLTDAQLDRVAATDLHWRAPLTVQFFVEHHPIAHPYAHLESIRSALNRTIS